MKNVLIRLAKISDYDAVEAIMKQVQQLHIDWRPDLYRMGETVLPYEMYADAVNRETFIVAETERQYISV